jgi:choline dehydrogenase-like flavoprotein
MVPLWGLSVTGSFSKQWQSSRCISDNVLAQGARTVMAEPEIDLSKTYDAILVGSGAAGGMAAHVLTTHGLQVLLLEAGNKLNIEQELRSMEWPYDNPHRGGLPPDSHALTLNECTIRNPPYGAGSEKYKHLYNYIGDSDYVKNIVVDEGDNPITGTSYAWVRARCLGGKTNIWGRLALRLSDYDFRQNYAAWRLSWRRPRGKRGRQLVLGPARHGSTTIRVNRPGRCSGESDD